MGDWQSGIQGRREALCGKGRNKKEKKKEEHTSFTAAHLKSYFKQNVTTLCGSVCTCTALHVQLFIYLFALLSRTSMPRECKRAGGVGGGGERGGVKNKDDEE